MLDLNTLIPPDSGLQLTNAFNINDRGEILAKSIPLGVTPIDDEDLGHVVLLIPCGDDHEHCGEGIESSDAAVTPRRPSTEAVATAVPRLSGTAKTIAESAAAWRAKLGVPVVGREH